MPDVKVTSSEVATISVTPTVTPSVSAESGGVQVVNVNQSSSEVKVFIPSPSLISVSPVFSPLISVNQLPVNPINVTAPTTGLSGPAGPTGPAGGVSSVNNLTGAITLFAGNNVSISDDGSNTVTISSSATGSGETDLGKTVTASDITVTSSSGTDVVLPAATTTDAGLLTAAKFDDITDNTAKVGITTAQANAITANTSKTGITTAQADAITANTAKVGITTAQADAITSNTAKVGITTSQADAITANTAKVGITTAQSDAITANTAKTGITTAQADAITANTAKVSADGSVTTHSDVTSAGSGAIITGNERTLLGTIEESADVTDTDNVTAAGALMDSEVTDLSGIKSVTISTLQVKPSEGAFEDGDKTKLDGMANSANNYVHPNHSGEVTSSEDGDTTITDDVVDEANLKVSNSPTDGYVLTARQNNTGGMTWEQSSTGTESTRTSDLTVFVPDSVVSKFDNPNSVSSVSDVASKLNDLIDASFVFGKLKHNLTINASAGSPKTALQIIEEALFSYSTHNSPVLTVSDGTTIVSGSINTSKSFSTTLTNLNYQGGVTSTVTLEKRRVDVETGNNFVLAHTLATNSGDQNPSLSNQNIVIDFADHETSTFEVRAKVVYKDSDGFTLDTKYSSVISFSRNIASFGNPTLSISPANQSSFIQNNSGASGNVTVTASVSNPNYLYGSTITFDGHYGYREDGSSTWNDTGFSADAGNTGSSPSHQFPDAAVDMSTGRDWRFRVYAKQINPTGSSDHDDITDLSYNYAPHQYFYVPWVTLSSSHISIAASVTPANFSSGYSSGDTVTITGTATNPNHLYGAIMTVNLQQKINSGNWTNVSGSGATYSVTTATQSLSKTVSPDLTTGDSVQYRWNITSDHSDHVTDIQATLAAYAPVYSTPYGTVGMSADISPASYASNNYTNEEVTFTIPVTNNHSAFGATSTLRLQTDTDANFNPETTAQSASTNNVNSSYSYTWDVYVNTTSSNQYHRAVVTYKKYDGTVLGEITAPVNINDFKYSNASVSNPNPSLTVEAVTQDVFDDNLSVSATVNNPNSALGTTVSLQLWYRRKSTSSGTYSSWFTIGSAGTTTASHNHNIDFIDYWHYQYKAVATFTDSGGSTTPTTSIFVSREADIVSHPVVSNFSGSLANMPYADSSQSSTFTATVTNPLQSQGVNFTTRLESRTYNTTTGAYGSWGNVNNTDDFHSSSGNQSYSKSDTVTVSSSLTSNREYRIEVQTNYRLGPQGGIKYVNSSNVVQYHYRPYYVSTNGIRDRDSDGSAWSEVYRANGNFGAVLDGSPVEAYDATRYLRFKVKQATTKNFTGADVYVPLTKYIAYSETASLTASHWNTYHENNLSFGSKVYEAGNASTPVTISSSNVSGGFFTPPSSINATLQSAAKPGLGKAVRWTIKAWDEYNDYSNESDTPSASATVANYYRKARVKLVISGSSYGHDYASWNTVYDTSTSGYVSSELVDLEQDCVDGSTSQFNIDLGGSTTAYNSSRRSYYFIPSTVFGWAVGSGDNISGGTAPNTHITLNYESSGSTVSNTDFNLYDQTGSMTNNATEEQSDSAIMEVNEPIHSTTYGTSADTIPYIIIRTNGNPSSTVNGYSHRIKNT